MNSFPITLLHRYDEIYNYNFKTGDKINGGVIGHFTQMVWKSSTRVGYGVAVASSPKWGTYGSKMVFVVAKYTPGGNTPPYTANVMPLIGKTIFHPLSFHHFFILINKKYNFSNNFSSCSSNLG